MKRILTLSALPVVALVSACGGGNEVVTTNANNVILNDAQENHTFTSDEPPPNGLDAVTSDAMGNDAGLTDNVTADPAANATGNMR